MNDILLAVIEGLESKADVLDNPAITQPFTAAQLLRTAAKELRAELVKLAPLAPKPLSAAEQRYLAFAADVLDDDDCQILEPNNVYVDHDEDGEQGAWVDARLWIPFATLDCNPKHSQPRFTVKDANEELLAVVAADSIEEVIGATASWTNMFVGRQLYTDQQTPDDEHSHSCHFFRLPRDKGDLLAHFADLYS